MKPLPLSSLLAALTLFSAPFSAPSWALSVVTSVKPLQLLVDEIIGEAGSSQVLIDPQQSPHHFQLRPSQLRQLSNSDVLLWISDHFETGLARLNQQLPASVVKIEISKLLDQALLIGEDHDLDGHLWLSPLAMAALATPLAEQLGERDSANAERYRYNAQSLQLRIQDWLKQARPEFSHDKPQYLLDHAFLAYLERDLELGNRGSLRNNHDHGASMQHLSHLHDDLDAHGAECLLVDRLPASAQARQLADKHHIDIRPVDLMGEANDIRSIVDLYQKIIEVLRGCQHSH